MNTNATHALDYAQRGLPVFPLARRSNLPLAHSHGHLDATTDAEVIKVMWHTTPNANIGIATGNGVLVFDVDPRNGGDFSLEELQRQHGAPPDTWTDRTPGGGGHFWLSYEPTLQLRGTKGLVPGIDIKAEGGYAVAPPSVRRDGEYVWLAGYSPDDLPIAPAPPWLLEMLSARSADARPRGVRTTARTFRRASDRSPPPAGSSPTATTTPPR